jgi:hypothetical protein
VKTPRIIALTAPAFATRAPVLPTRRSAGRQPEAPRRRILRRHARTWTPKADGDSPRFCLVAARSQGGAGLGPRHSMHPHPFQARDLTPTWFGSRWAVSHVRRSEHALRPAALPGRPDPAAFGTSSRAPVGPVGAPWTAWWPDVEALSIALRSIAIKRPATPPVLGRHRPSTGQSALAKHRRMRTYCAPPCR